MMNELERHILAAQGYVELELHEEARLELAHLPASASDRVDVIELTVLCLMSEGSWGPALALAHKLCHAEPGEPGGFIHAAYCLHEMGRTQEALDLLTKGPAALRTKAVYYYNMGCYLACLGHDDQALPLLKQSFEMDGRLRSHARNDHDLDRLRPLLEKP